MKTLIAASVALFVASTQASAFPALTQVGKNFSSVRQNQGQIHTVSAAACQNAARAQQQSCLRSARNRGLSQSAANRQCSGIYNQTYRSCLATGVQVKGGNRR